MSPLPRFDGPVSERTFLLDEPEGSDGVDPHETGAVYLAEPTPPARPARGLLLGLHGSGRTAGSYRDVPFYRYQRDRALRSGFIFASVSNGPAGWGLDEGLERVLDLLTLLRAELGRRLEVVPWGTSAGGVMLFRLVATLAAGVAGRGSVPPIRRAVATFPVYDLLSVFESSKGCPKA